MKEIIIENKIPQSIPNIKKSLKIKKQKIKNPILPYSNQNPKYQPEHSLFGYLWVSQFF